MFKFKKNKVDKLIEKLHKEVTAEVLSSKSKELCNESIQGYTCTRPKGHSNFHVSSAPDYFVVAWYFLLNDKNQ